MNDDANGINFHTARIALSHSSYIALFSIVLYGCCKNSVIVYDNVKIGGNKLFFPLVLVTSYACG